MGKQQSQDLDQAITTYKAGAWVIMLGCVLIANLKVISG